MKPESTEKLIKIFSKFPGIGPRQAARFGYFLVDADRSVIEELKTLLEDLKKIKRCPSCFRAYETDGACAICSDPGRETGKVAVVEKDIDLQALEKAGVYKGFYHVLGGLLSGLDAQSRDRLKLKELFQRVKKDAGIKEVIMALSATAEGEFSARYIERILEPLKKNRQLVITRLGRGLSFGAELEYLSAETLKHALDNRK